MTGLRNNQSTRLRGAVDGSTLIYDGTRAGLTATTVQGAIDELRLSDDVLVFRPGVAGDVSNVYGAWADLYAALQTSPSGFRSIVIDDTLGAAVVPAGAYDLDNVRLMGQRTAGNLPTLSIADGATLSNLRFVQYMSLEFQGDTPAIVIDADDRLMLEEVNFYCTGTSHAVEVDGAGTDYLIWMMGGGILAPLGAAASTFHCINNGDIAVQFGERGGVPYIESGVFSATLGGSDLDFYPQTPAHAVSYVHAGWLGVISTTGLVAYSAISDFISEDVTIGLKAEFVTFDTSGAPGAHELQDPATVPDGYEVTVKDIGNNANVNNIVVTTAAGDIDGNPSSTISVNNGALTYRSNGVDTWNIASQAG